MTGAVAGRFGVKTHRPQPDGPLLARWLIEISRVLFEDLHGQGLEVGKELA